MDPDIYLVAYKELEGELRSPFEAQFINHLKAQLEN
jgi:hypothetical protein